MHFEKKMTDCGAPLFVFEMPHAQSVACGVLVKAGTIDEKWPQEAGLAHAFEHMVFQGNKRFKNTKKIGAHIEEVGGAVNAWTAKEMTFFHAIVPKDEFSRGFMWLYHLLSSPSFAEKNIETEMQNVIQEIKKENDNPASLASKIFEETAYESHPLAKSTLGLIESVNAFTRERFLAYHEKFYCAQNFVFIVVGNVNAERALALINRHPWRDKKDFSVTRPSHAIKQEKKVKVFEKADIEQVHALIGTPIGTAKEKRTKALQLFTVMIDGGLSFPLFQEVRNKRGLCYTVSADIIPWTDCGLFRVYIGTDPKRYSEAIKVIKQVIQNCSSDKKLFMRAKKLLKGNIALKYEDSAQVLNSAATSTVFVGKPISPEEMIEEIDSVTFEDVESACAEYLNPENFTEVCVAPKGFTLHT